MTTGSSVLASDSDGSRSSDNGAAEANHHRRQQQRVGADHDKTEDTPMILANDNEADVTTVTTTSSTADISNGYVRPTHHVTAVYVCMYVCV